MLCIKSECDRLMHSEGLFIRITNSTPAWQDDALPPLVLIVNAGSMLVRDQASHARLRINGPSALRCFGLIASISVQLRHGTIHIAPEKPLIRARSVVQVHPGPPFKSPVNTRPFSLFPFRGISLKKPICQLFTNFTIGRMALHSGR